MFNGKWSGVNEDASELNEEVLNGSLNEPDKHEQPVGEDVMQYVELLATDFTAVKFIEEM